METEENLSNCTTQNENMQFNEAIKRISKILRPLHLDYNQSKYIFKEVRKSIDLQKPEKKSETVESLPLRSVETIVNTAYKLKGHAGLMIKTLFLTGARNNELTNIRVEDVYLDECKIKISKPKGGSHKIRFVPILKEHRDELDTYLKFISRNNGYLFESNRNTKYSTRRIQQILEQLSDISGIKAVPHQLRHSIAQYLYDRGMPLEQIQKFLGHSAIKTTQIYAKSSIVHVQKGYNEAWKKELPPPESLQIPFNDLTTKQ